MNLQTYEFGLIITEYVYTYNTESMLSRTTAFDHLIQTNLIAYGVKRDFKTQTSGISL